MPLVALVSAVPMLAEALSMEFDGIGEVRLFPAGRGDTPGLLRWLAPDAIVVDSALEAENARSYAEATGAPLVFVSFEDEALSVLGPAGWEATDERGLSAEAVRNVIVGRLYGRVEARPT